MTDNPFKTRPEDFINRSIKAAVSTLPVIGSPLAEYVQFVIGDPAQERRDDFVKSVADRLIALEDRHEALRQDNLRQNEQFQATFIEAAQASLRTAHDKKKAMLQNAILNAAIGTIDENIRHMFMQFIDRLTPLHVAMLALLDNPKANAKARQRAENLMAGGLIELIRAALPEVGDSLASLLARELENLGLANGANPQVTMSGAGLLERRSTDLGRAFLSFISDPDTGAAPI